MVRTVVAPYDGSALAARALPVAATVAMRCGADLHAVSVYEPPLPVPTGQGARVSDPHLEDEATALLQTDLESAVAAASSMHPTLRIETRTLRGNPASEIAHYAESVSADLVVMCSHGRGGFTRVWLGSVAEGLIRQLQIPILILPADESSPPMTGNFRRVLVALDCSTRAERVVESADDIAAPNASFVLLGVATPLHPLLQRIASDEEIERDSQTQRAVVQHYLDDYVQRSPIDRSRLEPLVTLDLHPARSIVATSGEVGADLIAMTTRAAGPLGRFFLGSVADKVVRASSVPVLLQQVE